MNELDTSLLSARLHSLADELTPAVDPRRQVAAARAQHKRKRRGRLVLVAVATATAAVVVGTTAAAGLLSAGADGDVADRNGIVTTTTAPSTPDAAPTAEEAAAAAAAEEAARRAEQEAAERWEPRAFQGVTFAVPPGARAADTVDTTPVSSWMDGPSLTWNGPSLGGDEYSFVSVKILNTFQGGLPPTDGVEAVTVPGAELAYMWISAGTPGDLSGSTVDKTVVGLDILAGGRRISLGAQLVPGSTGEQMARDLIASVVVG